jgi:hypothetical protein
MAHIVPTEGLDYLVNLALKNAESPDTLYLFLFSGGTATTVPAAAATLAVMGGTFAEADYTSYARVAVPTADWGTIGDDTVWGQAVRAATAAQKSFPAAGAADAAADINGFGVATASTGGVALYYSNFDDVTGIPSLALGDIIRVTPTFGLASAPSA